MKIKALKVTGLYGYFDKEIQFNEDVTVLVGINGSGKTSILNIIKWMLGPAIPELCTLEFKSIILIFDYFGSENIIECKHDESNFIFFTTQDGHKYEPLIISKIKEPWELKGNSKLKNQTIKFYNDLLINYYNNESFQHISDFKRINVIGTNRNSNLNKNHKINDIFFSEERNSFQSELTPIEESVRKVNSYFIEMNNELSGLENELISNLIYFNFNNFELNLDKNYIFPDESEIQRIKNTFKKYFERLNLNMYSSMNYSIEQYFDFFEKLLIQYKDKKDEDNLILRLYTNQFEKIKEIEVELERFQGMRDNQMQRLNNLIDCINSFFKDSNKVIFFNPNTDQINFKIIGNNKNFISSNDDLNLLSSGEQHLFILFSQLFFDFTGEGSGIFIIDEPELSLHVMWQENLILKMLEVSPPENQIIIATHSPILADRTREYAKILTPY